MQWKRYAEIGGALLWTFAREAPHRLAEFSGDRFVVMIDEFQHINKYIYRFLPPVPDNQMTTMAGGYVGTAESKIAPMLITGSAVGMMRKILIRQLHGCVQTMSLEKFTEADYLELGHKLSAHYRIPMTDECLLFAHHLLGGQPAYLRDLFTSEFGAKDLATLRGVCETILFEVSEPGKGRIRAGWEEYFKSASDELEQDEAKKIVLLLSKNNEREWSRKEIQEHCGLHDWDDQQLKRKLRALVAAGLIDQGWSDFDYHGLSDPTVENVFRLEYERDVARASVDDIKKQILQEFEQASRQL
jgi:hypothetical protein